MFANLTEENIFYLLKISFQKQQDVQIAKQKHSSFIVDLFTISKLHDIAPMVGYAIDKVGFKIDEQVKSKFQKEQMLAVFRYEQQNYELDQISTTLEKAKIDFIPLKGTVIRQYYPEPYLRTSADIDILIKEDDLEKALNVLIKELGYNNEEKSSHDVSLFSPSNIRIELHYSLIEKDVLSKADEPLKDVWNYAISKDDCSYHKLLTNEVFYYYHIAHMAKHYVNGGCGIKPFLDLVIINKNLTFDKQKLNELLLFGGLDKFAEQAENLSKVWFGDKEHTTLTKQMEEYLLRGGVYGNTENRVAVQQVKKGGKFKFICSRIFMPYNELKFKYPVLQKHKWLLPICQVRRWFKLIFMGGAKRSINEIKATNNISEQTKNATEEMIKQLGLE